jgi:hypothetical protein
MALFIMAAIRMYVTKRIVRRVCVPIPEIGIDPDTARGTITFYELPVSSLMSVPGAGVEPA